MPTQPVADTKPLPRLIAFIGIAELSLLLWAAATHATAWLVGTL